MLNDKNYVYALKKWLDCRGITNKEVADALGVSERSFSNKLNGKSKREFYCDEILTICDVFGADVSLFFDEPERSESLELAEEFCKRLNDADKVRMIICLENSLKNHPQSAKFTRTLNRLQARLEKPKTV